MISKQAINKSLEIESNIHLETDKSETCKVNINDLMFKVREKEKNQRKENLTFVCLVGVVVVVTGVIASI